MNGQFPYTGNIVNTTKKEIWKRS